MSLLSSICDFFSGLFSSNPSATSAASKATGTSFTQLTSAMEVLADRGITASKMGTGEYSNKLL